MLAVSAPARSQDVDWTRPYLGGQIGYSWDKLSITSTPPGAFDTIGDLSSVIGGIEDGKNFIQQNGFVAGIVADFNWLNARGRASISKSEAEIEDRCGEGCFVTIATDTTSDVGLHVTWKASLRGKAGILAIPTCSFTLPAVSHSRTLRRTRRKRLR